MERPLLRWHPIMRAPAWYLVSAALVAACGGEVADLRPTGSSPDAGAPDTPLSAGTVVEPPDEPGACDVPADGSFAVPPAIVELGGYAELLRFDDGGATREVLPLAPGTVAVPGVAPEADGTAFFTLVSPGGEIAHGESMALACPRWCGATGTRTLRVPSDVPTIQAAIDEAGRGDTVLVEPGVYHESLLLRSGVRLVGSGAAETVLDGDGAARNLVDFSGASDVVIRGFTLRHTTRADDCLDVMSCAGNYYRAAVYADGHADQGVGPCDPTTALIADNVFTDNDIGVLVYFLPRVVVRNNLFVQNAHALVLNHLQQHALVTNNVFWQNAEVAVTSQAAYLHFFENVVGRSPVGYVSKHVQAGQVRCNLVSDAPSLSDALVLGTDGNFEADPLFVAPEQMDFALAPGSPARDAGCFGPGAIDLDGSVADVGATGGLLGAW